ncbi:MAG: hypothetical protein K0S61_3748 [Anaerocolumna sp.]|jgi:hypothetical protein|nr:hypothetical protein [Anaerocolumna sp.]
MDIKNYIVLGNGFSINLVDELKKSQEINLKNLFANGDKVKWPDNDEMGFLSRKHCEHLWTLGARSCMSNEDSFHFINNIITCLNVYNLAKSSNDTYTSPSDNIYLAAYNELSTYLKNLFIYYNSLISDDELLSVIDKIDLIKYIKDEIDKDNEVIVITYNYDIFLERLLKVKGIPYIISGFNNDTRKKVRIIKPHGSISFSSKINTISKTYEIKDTFDSIVANIKELKIKNTLIKDMSLVNAIIPPAGDSNRVSFGWPSTLRKILMEKIKKSTEKDSLIIYGISYDHVDRKELDDIITNIDSLINVKYINPYPSDTFDLVLSSVFKNYIQLKEFRI